MLFSKLKFRLKVPVALLLLTLMGCQTTDNSAELSDEVLAGKVMREAVDG